MQQVFTEFPALYGTDDILYHIGRNLEIIANKPTVISTPTNALYINQNFSGSIINGIANENGNVDILSGTPQLGAVIDGVPTLLVNHQNYVYSPIFPIDIKRTYCIDFEGKTTGSCLVAIIRMDINKQPILNAGDTILYPPNFSFNNSTFANKKIYISANVGNTTASHTADTVFAKLIIYGISGTSEIHKLKLRLCDYGEAVPYTLPYLPTGQIVYDPATNDVGRFNGTDINWFM